MKIIVGHGREHGFVLIPVTQHNNQFVTTIAISNHEATWLHAELRRQLDLTNYEELWHGARTEIVQLERTIAGLRGALGRAKRGGR